MADTNTDSIVESGASTSADSQSIEPTVSNPLDDSPDASSSEAQAPTSDDPWENLGKDTGDEVDEPAADTAKPDADDADDELEPEKSDDGAKKADSDTEKSDEDQLLEEVFADGAKDKTDKPEETDLDSPEMAKQMIDSQRNAMKKAWAARVTKRAEIVKDFQFPDKETGAFKPIAEVADTWSELNPERFNEFATHSAHQLVDANPDATFQRAYAVKMQSINPNWDIRNATLPTLDEFIASVNQPTNGYAPAPPTAPSALTSASPDNRELAELTAELDRTLDWDWRDESLDYNFVDDREIALSKSLRQMEAKVKAETTEKSTLATELQTIKDQLAGLTGNAEQENERAFGEEVYKSVNSYRESFEAKVTPYLIRNAGLEKSPNDTPVINAFKENLRVLYEKTDYEKANNFESAFESFAVNESSVKGEIDQVYKRIVDAKSRAAAARIQKDTAKAEKFDSLADDEKKSLSPLLAQANKEFIPLRIAPQMAVIGELSGKLSNPLREASERQEIVSNGSGVSASPSAKPVYKSMDDVFDGVVAEIARDTALRANA